MTVIRDAMRDEPPADIRYRHRVHLGAASREIWTRRELLRTLAERELRARYKQTSLGFAWAVVTPVALMVVFSVFFQRVAKVDTHGVPYPLFAYVGLLPWTFFSTSVSQGGQSLVLNVPLLNKVYCPREVFPLASVALAAVDTLAATSALLLLFVLNRFVPAATSVWVPVIMLVQLCFTVGVTLIISAVVVYVRDLRPALPVLLQLGLFATPVAYGIDVVAQQWHWLYSLLNPMAPVIDGYRRTVLYGEPPQWGLLGLGALTSAVLFVGGYAFFKRLEMGFTDVA